MKEKRKFSLTEKKILRLLFQTKAPMTTYEIAKEIGISFQTAKKYIQKLIEEGIINQKWVTKQ